MSYGNYPDLKGVKKVLVVKLRHLGDVLLTSPILSVLKTSLPDAKIDAYIYKEAAPMLEGHPDLHKLLLYDRGIKKLPLLKKLASEYALLKKIQREKYDLVINLTEGDRGALAAKFSKARIRVGYDTGPKKKRKVYTHRVKVCPGLRHTVERGLDAVRRIGIFPSFEERNLYFEVPEEAKTRMRSLLEEREFSEFYLIHPVSRWRFKCYPSKKMQEVLQKLLKSGKKIVLVSGKDPIEKEMIERIKEGIHSSSLLDLSGQVNLKELGALIQLAERTLCVDSVCFHMANALKAPVLALFGPTSDVTWGAWKNPHARVLTKDLSCRPCYMDGCGGSKVSDCLHRIEVSEILQFLTATKNLQLL